MGTTLSSLELGSFRNLRAALVRADRRACEWLRFDNHARRWLPLRNGFVSHPSNRLPEAS